MDTAVFFENFLPALFALLLAMDLLLAVSSRLLHCIRLVAFQGLIIGLIPLAMWQWTTPPHTELIVIAVLNIALKCVLIPYLLARTMRSAHVCRELEPLVGYGTSLLIVLASAAFSFFFCRELPLPGENVSFLAAPVAFTTILTGLFLIVSRKKAITQAIGFLTFENGITAFGAGMALEYGLVVELGILLDVFVLVFVMGIAVFRISREFQHIDSDRLNTLGDWSGDDENDAEMKGEN